MLPVDIQWFWIAPELVLGCVGMIALLAAVAGKAGRRAAAKTGIREEMPALGASEWLSILGVAAAGVLALMVGLGSLADPSPRVHFWGSMVHDPFSAFFKVMTALATLLTMAMVAGYRRAIYNRAELYVLLLFAAMAIFFMASASELVLLFLAIEFLSLTSYVLVGYLKEEARSSEAGIKYFLFGTVCSAVMLYGMSFLYGLTGNTTLQGIAVNLAVDVGPARLQIAILAAILVMAGLGFKISMVPFQQWVPDAYEGAPTPVTAFLSVASKAAGFAVVVRVLTVAFGLPELSTHWAGIVGVLAMLTMTWGNTAALWQTNMKRMLAYSSVAQAGYVMVGLVAMGIGGAAAREFALPGVLLYLLVYLFMNLGAFAVVIAVANATNSDEMSAYDGLAQRAPWLAALFTLFLLSLIGIPPTAGFIGKLYLFLAAIRGQSPFLLVLAVVMVVNSVISAYYYLNVVRLMYLREAKDAAPVPTPRPLAGALALTVVATLGIFLYAQPSIDVAQMTAEASTLLQGVFGLRAGR